MTEKSIQELIAAIEAYHFMHGGHPLKNCAEWIELKKRLGAA